MAGVPRDESPVMQAGTCNEVRPIGICGAYLDWVHASRAPDTNE